ncbi:hypothetical protein ACOMHN_058323 [Nucella lapillus]
MEWGGHCYWTNDDITASDMSHTFTHCQQQGGQPFTFISLEEVINITASLRVYTVEVYVPAIQINGSYYWFSVRHPTNGTDYTPTFFSDDVIDRDVRHKDCVILLASRFEAQQCSSGFRFVCQKDLNQTRNDITCDVVLNVTSDDVTTISTSAAVAMTSLTTDRHQSRPTLPGAIVDQGQGTDNVFNKSKDNTVTNFREVIHGRGGPLLPGQHTPWSIVHLLKANRDRTDITVQTVNSIDVSNLTHAEAESALQAVYQLLLTDNSTDQGLDDRVVALFLKMAHVRFVDEDMLTVYVKGTALIIYGDKLKKKNKEVNKSMERILSKANTTLYDQQLDQLVVKVKNVNITHGSDDVTLKSALGEKKNVIHLSRSLFSEKKGRASTVVYGDLHQMLPSNLKGALKGGKVASHVISIVVQSGKERGEGHGHSGGHSGHRRGDFAVNFTLPYLCSEVHQYNISLFPTFALRLWADDGCWTMEVSDSHTTCTCNHLSTFAVLVTFTQKPPMSEDNVRATFVLTAIGCSLSIAGLALTLITYIYLGIVMRERMFIHANLALSLLLAQTLFIASDTAYRSKVACKVVAGLLHFFFLASFAWMLVEGVALYRTCTRGLLIFSPHLRLRYCLLGWGVPLLVLTVSVGLQFPHYGRGLDHSCWLSMEDGAIWAFLGPMLLIVCVNVVILGMVLRVFLSLKANSKKSEAARVRAGLRAIGMLLPLLGATWLLSLLVSLSAVFTYLFIFCNSLQGLMIFILHCVGNEEVVNFDDVKVGMATEGHISSHEGQKEIPIYTIRSL